jgi:hypothetical protein
VSISKLLCDNLPPEFVRDISASVSQEDPPRPPVAERNEQSSNDNNPFFEFERDGLAYPIIPRMSHLPLFSYGLCSGFSDSFVISASFVEKFANWNDILVLFVVNHLCALLFQMK